MGSERFLRGSEWRKWDLHVHSPASENFKGDYATLIDSMKKCEAEVIGINDYCTFEGYKTVLNAGAITAKTLLPVVEMRMNNVVANRKNASGGRLINFHLVFNDDPNVFRRAETFLNSLKCYNAKGGNEQLGNVKKDDLAKTTFDYANVISQLDEYNLREEVLIWLPYDEYGGIDDIDPQDNFFKLGLINKADMMGTSNRKQIEFFLWENSKFTVTEYRQWFEKPKPCIKGSDTHEANYPIGKLRGDDSQPTEKYCWIKADPTFEGLKQIVHEPENRVYVGELPPKLEVVQSNKELFIDKIVILSTHSNGEWFDEVGEVPLNPDLVSIIGNKGSGKSALTDIIASSANSTSETFSFLNEEKFLAVPQNAKYTSEVHFTDGYLGLKPLSSPWYDEEQPSKAVYLSQFFVRDLCESEDPTRLQNEIDRVIFSHIPEEETQESNSLPELISKKSQYLISHLQKEKAKLADLNRQIEQYEGYQKPEFKQAKLSALRERERQLKYVLENEKPKEVTPPDKTKNEHLMVKIKALQEERSLLSKDIEKVQDALNSLVKDDQLIGTIRARIQGFLDELAETEGIIRTDQTFAKYGITADNTFRRTRETIDLQGFDKASTRIAEEIRKSRESKAKTEGRLREIPAEIKAIQNGLTANEKEYNNYLESLNKWEEKKKKIEGDSKTPDTIKNLKAWINFVEQQLDGSLQGLYNDRTDSTKKIVDLKFQEMESLRGIYAHVQQYSLEKLTEFGIPKEEFIEFNTRITVVSDFADRFLGFINQNRKGTFYGSEDGRTQLTNIMNSVKIDNQADAVTIPDRLLNALRHNLAADPNREKAEFENSIDAQLLSGPRSALYDYIYSFEYLKPSFEIRYARKRIRNLSPGERGTLLVIFYLLIDKDNRPIIIDQPEENLDNETVFKRLVPFVKKVKRTRQIIIVTHNPNLAIVCDSEQIIHASIDKEHNNKVTYTSGSIEFLQIRHQAINILEGTGLAFKNRQDKYDLR